MHIINNIENCSNCFLEIYITYILAGTVNKSTTQYKNKREKIGDKMAKVKKEEMTLTLKPASPTPSNPGSTKIIIEEYHLKLISVLKYNLVLLRCSLVCSGPCGNHWQRQTYGI